MCAGDQKRIRSVRKESVQMNHNEPKTQTVWTYVYIKKQTKTLLGKP